MMSLLLGSLVGISLGMTGGGGAILAVPLLVYGLAVPAKQAVGISLATVGVTAFVGFVDRWRRGQVDLRLGLLFAAAGSAGTPLGIWAAHRLPEPGLLLAFAGLMLGVAAWMWRGSATANSVPGAANAAAGEGDRCEAAAAACRRDVRGRLVLNSRCAMLLLAAGLGTGVLAGLFGVGGGFVIVPALVFFSGMPMQQAVGTSLFVIALVSLSGVTIQLGAGASIPLDVAAPFAAGGVGGLWFGQAAGGRLSETMRKRVFAAAIVAVAAMVIVRNLTG